MECTIAHCRAAAAELEQSQVLLGRMRAAEGESGFGAPVTSLFAQIRQQTLGGQQRPVNAMGKGTRMAKPTMPGVETAAKPNLEWQWQP